MAKPKIYIDGKEGTTGLQIYDRLAGREDIELLLIDEEKRKDSEERRKLIHAADIVFLCLPDMAAIDAVALAEGSKARIIDASTAHRTAAGWTYGMAELSNAHREAIQKSNRVANPGCHATGFITSTYPLVAQGVIPKDYPMTVFSLTGYSGGGKKMIAEYESPEKPQSYFAPRIYGLTLKHKHLPEMQHVTGITQPPVFMPIVCDFYSGMATCIPLHTNLFQKKVTKAELVAMLKDYYKGHPLISVEDTDVGFLAANEIRNTNKLKLYIEGNDERMTLISVFDNLGKGASGAAVQNMNLVLGLPETTGLI